MEETNAKIVEEIKNSIAEKNKVIEDKAKELEDKVFNLSQKVASFEAPAPVAREAVAYDSLAQKLRNREPIKNLTDNGTGNIQVVSEIVRGMVDKNKVSSKIRTFYGDNAQVNVPVFYPGLAKPAAKARGATGGAADETAVLAPVSLTPFPFLSILPIDRLALNTTSLQSSLVDIFGDAFGEGWENQILNGAGSASYEFTGIFNATWIGKVNTAISGNIKTAASATAVTWKELASLAKLIRAKASGSERLALILHPDLIASVITATGASPAIENEYWMKGTIAGVPVIESTFAPSTFTTGKYVACACDLNAYAGAFVRTVNVDPITVMGDMNIYEQASIYANGTPLIQSSFAYLKLA